MEWRVCLFPPFTDIAVHGELASAPAVRSISFPLTYLIGGLLAGRFRLSHRILPVVAGLFVGLGMCLVAAFPEVRVMAYVASFAIGVGMACFFMTWELLFSTQSAHWAVGQIGCAAVISSALYLII